MFHKIPLNCYFFIFDTKKNFLRQQCRIKYGIKKKMTMENFALCLIYMDAIVNWNIFFKQIISM